MARLPTKSQFGRAAVTTVIYLLGILLLALAIAIGTMIFGAVEGTDPPAWVGTLVEWVVGFVLLAAAIFLGSFYWLALHAIIWRR